MYSKSIICPDSTCGYNIESAIKDFAMRTRSFRGSVKNTPYVDCYSVRSTGS